MSISTLCKGREQALSQPVEVGKGAVGEGFLLPHKTTITYFGQAVKPSKHLRNESHNSCDKEHIIATNFDIFQSYLSLFNLTLIYLIILDIFLEVVYSLVERGDALTSDKTIHY